MGNELLDYRGLLEREFTSRTATNPNYSLRAFARDLRIAASRLSEVLSGKRGLSSRNAEKIARAMPWSGSERRNFCDLVEAAHGRSALKRRIAQVRIGSRTNMAEYRPLQEDSFRAIADWYHFAILELATLAEFRSDVRWVAERLGIRRADATSAVDRLARLGLLDISRSPWRPVHAKDAVGGDVPSEAIRRFHKQILEKAVSALELQTVENREFTANLVCIGPDQLARAKARLRTLRREFVASLDAAPGRREEVYCLSMQFFRLTERNKTP